MILWLRCNNQYTIMCCLISLTEKLFWVHWLWKWALLPSQHHFRPKCIYVKCLPRPIICSGVGPLTLYHGRKQCKTVTEQKHPCWDNRGGCPFSAEVAMFIPWYKSTCNGREDPMHCQWDNSAFPVGFCCILWAHSLIMLSVCCCLLFHLEVHQRGALCLALDSRGLT